MPVAVKAAYTLANEITGGVSFNTIEDVARLGPLRSRVDVPYAEYEAQFLGLWERLVESIDWNRVLIEATSEHIRRQDADPAHASRDYGDEICPECVEAALKARERRF